MKLKSKVPIVQGDQPHDHLKDDGLSAVLQRCRRRERALVFHGRLNHWSRFTLTALALLLVAATLGKRLGFVAPLVPSLIAIALVLLISIIRSGMKWQTFRLPRWSVVAWLDKHSLARGQLMTLSENANSGLSVSIPRTALLLPFPPLAWKMFFFSWIGVAGLTVLFHFTPVSALQSAEQHSSPLRVQAATENLERLKLLDPKSQAFVAAARKSLEKLSGKQDGLTRADFDALERLEGITQEKLEQKNEQLQRQRDSLSKLESLIAENEAEEGSASAARQLAEELNKQRDTLQGAGLPREMMDKLINRAQEMAEKAEAQAQDAPSEQKKNPRPAFSAAAIESLKNAIGELKERTEPSWRPGKPPGGQPGDGESENPTAGSGAQGDGVGEEGGPVPLKYSNRSDLPEGDFASETFGTRASPDTVMLATSMSRRGQAPQHDESGQSTRTFQEGTTTPFEERTVLPRHRAMLEEYFGNNP